MTVLVVLLAVLGFLIPAVAALFAYWRTRALFAESPAGSYETIANLGDILRRIYSAQIEAVKWPAIWALVGVCCGSTASVLSVLSL